MKTIIKVVLITLLSVSVFTTCNGPMGMGDEIDFVPPVLTLDPVPNPYYVREGSILSGTVTDNDVVARVILINTATGKELFPVKRDGDNWEIDLLFTEDQNGEKIVGQIIAYDRAGNSGEPSIAFVTMIVDIRPPIVENITIQRTDTRIARLESYRDLKRLETTDPNGEKKDELYKYQNGWFTISGVVNDEETKIEIISLDIYDVTDEEKSKTKLLSLPVDEGYTNYFPRWSIKEDDIINAGAKQWGDSYKTNYYKKDGDHYNGERYYYNVVIKAVDKSNNTNDNPNDDNIPIEEFEGCMCLFAKSDEPKGMFDTGVAPKGSVATGTPLPVDFYDDDSLLWAYTGLLTYEQWHGQKPIYGTVTISGETDNDKLLWLKKRLKDDGGIVYDWKFDKHSGLSDSNDPIVELIKYNEADPKSLDEKIVYLMTGNGQNDYGDYILFTLAADKKLPPHDGKGPEETNTNIWRGRFWPIAVVDENVPVIVFDTQNGCPEENTFPLLDGGEFFNIKGYTLRENQSGDKKVTTFRVAWIPFGMKDEANGKTGPDDYIVEVQEALKKKTFTTPAGVQYWDFVEKGILEPGVIDNIDDNEYNKQSFTKKFSVLGQTDDTNGLKNFTFNGKLENETKLFVFYAVDNMGHEVFRQLRLLGMKIPPTLTVYDISNEIKEMPERAAEPKKLPDPNTSGNTDPSTGGVTAAYFTLLNTYNTDPLIYYNTLRDKSVKLSSDDLKKLETIPFQIYPRGTVLKYWIKAAKSEKDIAITSIKMTDVTFSSSATVIGNYIGSDMAYTYCESFPDVTQRTFLIEATDALGNIAQIQRTIAVTNAAKLESITTTRENGTYGIGEKIILTAKFSNQIYVDGGGKPKLNLRYELRGGGWKYEQLECKESPTLLSPKMNLEFEFTVPEETASEKPDGRLQTLYDDVMFSPSEKRPIILPSKTEPDGSITYTTKIMDSGRKDAAFLPGYVNESVSVPNWTSADQQSLQKTKDIKLDGIRPVINSPVIISGKTAYSANPDMYYFKTGETIYFTLSATKDVMAQGTPVLSYHVASADVNNTAFKYQRPGGSNALVFALPVNSDNCKADGNLLDVSLLAPNGSRDIIDNVRNSVKNNIPESLGNVNISNLLPPGTSVYIRLTPPYAPPATIEGSTFNESPVVFNTRPNLVIPRSGDTLVDTIEYSFNDGFEWVTSTNDSNITVQIPVGKSIIQVRYKDRAGNISPLHRKEIEVNDTFPKLIQVSATEPNGWYTYGKNLTFNLAFEEPVKVNKADNVKLTIWNRNASVTSDNAKITLDVAAGQTSLTTTIKFNWTSISGKEMRDGLYIQSVDLSGLTDAYGNIGGSGTSALHTDPITVTPTYGSSYTCSNLPYTNANTSIKVDSINPGISTRTPAHSAQASAVTSTITLTFNEPIQKGSGIITIRPRGNYSIPPVFADEGYKDSNGTYISSFYDIYTNSALDAADRNNLTVSASAGQLTTAQTYNATTGAPTNPDTANPSMTRLFLNQRTGQSYGPYKKTTQGLIAGRGYSGNYTSGATVASPLSGTNAPDTAVGYMVPDIATKWVLDYQYKIDETSGAVANIRNVLTKAKFRWQEIDVVNTSIANTATTGVVTIALNEPLLNGLDWDVYYPAGTFTDMAGNPAAVCGGFTNGNTNGTNNDYWFTSYGVQPPVIRVNRRSYDARNENWTTKRTYANTTSHTSTGWNVNTAVSDKGLSADLGWHISNFNLTHYRVESESINAAIKVGIYQGTTNNANRGAARGSFAAANVSVANPGATVRNDTLWSTANNDTPGTWVLSNIIRRSATAGGQIYRVIKRDGMIEERQSNGAFSMFRSYNRDLTSTELNNIDLNPSTNGVQGIIEFEESLEASKNYIAASATLGSVTEKGYEGVYRTVVMLNVTTARDLIVAQGSNIKNGMPSIAGFPIREEGVNGDFRFFKAFNINTTNNQHFWVSTEIVSELYFIGYYLTATTSGNYTIGDLNNHFTVNYGDLTYCRHQ
jgi:hypothetical protein